MPRGRTDKVKQLKLRLLERLEHGLFRAGDRFLSLRQIADQFAVSYQTAHRVVDELCAAGHLERRARSGTYVAGSARRLDGVQLCFDPRAARRGSFGDKLLGLLRERLDAAGIDCRVDFGVSRHRAPARDRLPILWESPAALDACMRARREAVLIGDRPPHGIESMYIDSVSTDDRAGGVYAAQLLVRRSGRGQAFALLTGPRSDARSQARVEGFLSVAAGQPIVGGWDYPSGYRAAAEAVRVGRRGIFCCNDRLAEAVVAWCAAHGAPRPPLVGFDDAPIARTLDLTTIAIPWNELVDALVQAIRARLAGSRAAASNIVLNPQPVVRGL